MALTALADATDAIPLLDDAGGGVYSKGRNTATDFRREFLGAMLFSNSTTDMFSPRTGVLGSGVWNTAGNKPADLLALPQGSPNQQITVLRGRCVAGRTGVGGYLISFETDTTFTMPAADGTNPRIDVVYVYAYDKGPFGADAFHGPKLLVETGTPAGSPVAPSVPADAVKICQVFRRTTGGSPSGNIIQAGDITDLRKSTAWRGEARKMMPGDLLTDAGGFHGELRFRESDAGILAICDVDELIDRWSVADSKWHATQPITMYAPGQSFSGGVANGVTTTLATLVIPDLGFDYQVIASGGFEYTTADANALVGCQITLGSTAVDVNAVSRGLAKWPGASGAETKWAWSVPSNRGISSVLTGATSTWRLLCKNYSAASGVTVINGGQFCFNFTITPV